MQRVGSLASVYTGQPAGTPNCRPPKATFCAVLGLDVAGGVAGVEVVVLVEATVDDVDVLVELAVWRPRPPGVETLGPEPPPHAASSNPNAATTARITGTLECCCKLIARRFATEGWAFRILDTASHRAFEARPDEHRRLDPPP